MTQTSSEPPAKWRSSELSVLITLTLLNGVVAFDRLTIAYLSPYIVKDMGLNNAQLGLIAGALSLAIAFTSFLGGRLADKTGLRKLILIVGTVIFSIASGAAGIAATFAVLLIARFVLGAAEGPLVPLSLTEIAESSAPKRRGLNMGIMQMAGAFLLGGMLGPVIAINLADDLGWRTAVLLSAGPGLLLALAMFFILRPDIRRQPPAGERELSLAQAFVQLLQIPNMRIALAIAALFTGWLVLQNTFLAVFLTEVKQLAPTTAGWVISMGGIAGVIGGISLPLLSDRIGRRPVMIGATFAGVICPIALLALPGDPILLGLAVLIGWLPLGIAPLYCAAVPTESVSPKLAATAVGLTMGTAELMGGVVAPSIAGWVADLHGLEAVFWICIGLALAAAIAALALQETAPCKRAPIS